jgi:hypothetical protein
LIYRQGPWPTVEQLEFAIFEYLGWWNQRRLHGEIGMIPPVEKEAAHYAQPSALAQAGVQWIQPLQNPGRFNMTHVGHFSRFGVMGRLGFCRLGEFRGYSALAAIIAGERGE